MSKRDYGRIAAIGFIAVAVPTGIGLTIFWTVAARFPGITLGGWILLCVYLLVAAAVPTALTPLVSRAFGAWRYTWRVIALVWVSITAIAGLLAWPNIESYVKPFFVVGSHAL
jgi:hypothetical protein